MDEHSGAVNSDAMAKRGIVRHCKGIVKHREAASSDGKAMIAWRRKVMIRNGKAVNRIDMCGNGKAEHR